MPLGRRASGFVQVAKGLPNDRVPEYAHVLANRLLTNSPIPGGTSRHDGRPEEQKSGQILAVRPLSREGLCLTVEARLCLMRPERTDAATLAGPKRTDSAEVVNATPCWGSPVDMAGTS